MTSVHCPNMRDLLGNANIVFNLLKSKGKPFKGFGANDGGGNNTAFRQRVVFRDLQDSLCLVVEFRPNMSSCVVVALIEVKHSLDVNVLLARPLHQVAH